MAAEAGYGYGKRPLWQWILLYAVIGLVIYAVVYYFFFAKNGNPMYGPRKQYSPAPVTPTTPAPTPTPATSPAAPPTSPGQPPSGSMYKY